MPRCKPPAPGENRVVFFGDSITDIWKLDEYFPGKPYINRGIGGQTTPQMLVRFRQDVIDLHPKVVDHSRRHQRHRRQYRAHAPRRHRGATTPPWPNWPARTTSE